MRREKAIGHDTIRVVSRLRGGWKGGAGQKHAGTRVMAIGAVKKNAGSE